MLKKALIKKIAKDTGKTQKLVAEILDSYHDMVIEAVANGEEVKIVGFGKYTTRKVSNRVIQLKGREIHSEEKYKPRFVSSKEFVNRVVEGVK